MLENEKRRCDTMISDYENDKIRIIVEAAEIERKLIESFREEEIRLLSLVREKDYQLYKLSEDVKATAHTEKVSIDEIEAMTIRRIDRQQWKHLCGEMSEITVRMCTGALAIPEFRLKSSTSDDDTIGTNVVRMVSGNDYSNCFYKSSSSSGSHLVNSISHSLAAEEFFRMSRLSGNVLVKKDYLSTLLLLSKVRSSKWMHCSTALSMETSSVVSLFS